LDRSLLFYIDTQLIDCQTLLIVNVIIGTKVDGLEFSQCDENTSIYLKQTRCLVSSGPIPWPTQVFSNKVDFRGFICESNLDFNNLIVLLTSSVDKSRIENAKALLLLLPQNLWWKKKVKLRQGWPDKFSKQIRRQQTAQY
jgi:hypothetical protein